ncbi:XRE family transcriptional regulator [Streptomyces sp. NPDC057249]|uniref:XRE family transcriptional regulator n=1 Tax=Streptomyces sp. NPDC057249 TaxID=3346067 RepID=UPI00362ADD37
MFDVLRPGNGDPAKTNRATGEFSNAHVAETVSGYGDGTLTAAYIGKLRAGEGDNPSIRVARLLARFFQVPAGYFVEDDVTESIVSQFQLVRQLHEQGVKNLAMRAAGLSPASKEALLKMVDAARALEGLPESPEALA